MRLQLALNVPDLDDAIAFYSSLFATQPYKVKPGYANWEIVDPPLKLVVFQQADAEPGSINHLGVETETSAEVIAAEARLTESGLTTTGVDDAVCCHAQKTETWVDDPWGNRWEWYLKLADHEPDATTIDVVAAAGTGGSGPVEVCCS